MSAIKPATEDQVACVEAIFQRIASDLSMIADRELTVGQIECDVEGTRPAGAEKIHISFRLGFTERGETTHGCLLVPLPDAVSLACCLMMVPEEVVRTNRTTTTLDRTTKDAMLEVGNFICGATDSALRALGMNNIRVSFEGCQGVKPDVRPVLLYTEGEPLIVGRAEAALADYPTDTMVLMIPVQTINDAA